jgi:hypothetical protein
VANCQGDDDQSSSFLATRKLYAIRRLHDGEDLCCCLPVYNLEHDLNMDVFEDIF